jgi:hypothetical protein
MKSIFKTGSKKKKVIHIFMNICLDMVADSVLSVVRKLEVIRRSVMSFFERQNPYSMTVAFLTGISCVCKNGFTSNIFMQKNIFHAILWRIR